MSSLVDAQFVAAMLGTVPPVAPQPVAAPERAASLPPIRILRNRRVPEPTPEQIARVDARIVAEQLAEQGVYLAARTLRAYIAETNTALHQEWLKGKF